MQIFGSLWIILAHYGSLWVVMVHFAPFWLIPCFNTTVCETNRKLKHFEIPKDLSIESILYTP